MAKDLTDIPWDTLVGKIRAGYCTPFIGTGASFPAVPLAKDLAKVLLDQYGKPCPLPDVTDLAKVVEFLSIRQTDRVWPKLTIAAFINRCPVPDFEDPSEPHRLLADLELPLYLTTNYDDFMAAALDWRKHHVQPGQVTIECVHQDFCRWTDWLLRENTSIFDRPFDLTPSEPVVFHFHGHSNRSGAQKNAVHGIVASEDDYLDFLVTVAQELKATEGRVGKKTVLPGPVRSALTGTTLLFLGYGLNDYNFRVVLRALRKSLTSSDQQLNVAVQFAGDDPKELRDYVEQYFQGQLTSLHVFWGTAREFAGELRRKWQQ